MKRALFYKLLIMSVAAACLPHGLPAAAPPAAADSTNRPPQSVRKKLERSLGIKIQHQVKAPVPALRFYRNNYFLFYSEPVKFQFSFQYRFVLLGDRRNESGFYIAYTQKSLWDLYNWEGSVPFIENNYAPELFYRFDLGSAAGGLRHLQLGIWHESNGLGEEQVALSRAWNRVYLQAHFELGDNLLSVKPVIWFPFLMDGNEDICDYLGYAQLTLETGFFRRFMETRFQLILRKGFHRELQRGSLEFNVTVGPFVIADNSSVLPVAFFFQLWHGYGETLLQYNQKATRLRAGFRFTLE